MKIYVASSWRNPGHPAIVHILKSIGHEVYDYRHPEPGNDGFKWEQISDKWAGWTDDEYTKALSHPAAEHGFALDMNALKACDALVLVLQSGNSAHLEAGYAVGAGKRVFVLLDGETRPDLMYKMCEKILTSPDQLFDVFGEPLGECHRCDGCGRIASGEEGAPWSVWEQMPPGSDLAVKMGIVMPVKCPTCGGTGKAKRK